MTTQVQPTIRIRRADDRFHSEHGWLNSWHTFSFADHYDPAHMGFEGLRVINDDVIAPKMGFGEHPHRDMEIFTYVISGQLEHRDSMGNGSVIGAGDFQYMSAASGVRHSEFNPSKTDPVHLLQIWLIPNEKGGEPRYEERTQQAERPSNALTLLASADGRDDSIIIRQDAKIHFGKISAGQSLTPAGGEGQSWIQMISGSLNLSGERLEAGDGAAISGSFPTLQAESDSQFLLFKLS